jgi:hypothetical protein
MSDKNPEIQITASRSEYKGHPMLSLTSGANERYPFSFGLTKAKRILACIDDIKAFVADAEAKAAKASKVAVK